MNSHFDWFYVEDSLFGAEAKGDVPGAQVQ